MPNEDKPTRTLNCLGLLCPEPLLQTRENIDAVQVGEVLEVIADDPAAEEDIKRFAKRSGHELLRFEKGEDRMKFLLKRTR